MSDSRLQNTKRNIFFSYVDTIISLAFSFVSRTIIVQVLGEQYLGLSSLFVSIFQVLNMAELGFSVAIIYNMYKPIAENDIDTVCALLNYYRKIYRRISIIIISVGLCLMPFIPYIINGSWPSDVNIYLLYFLFLINTGASYSIYAYKTALLNALQRLDLSKIAYTIVDLLQCVFQILCLVIFRNYYLFVVCMIAGTVFKNISTAYISKKMFPQFACRGTVTKETKKDVISRVKGIFICNVSSVTYTTFDSIILSVFVGLTSVAIYSNYLTVFNGVYAFVAIIRNGMQASVGNSVAVETKEKNYKDVFLWQFLFSYIATWAVTCMVNLYQPFMKLWMGTGLLLPNIDIILICIWFYVTVVENAFFLYLGGNGFWWEMRWPYILSAVTNIVLNIVLGKRIGITGIIFSTLFSTVVFGMLWQCAIVFRYYFNTSMLKYQKRQFVFFIVCALSCGISYVIKTMINVEGVSGLIIIALICTAVSIIIQAIIFCRMEEFKKGKEILLHIMHLK